jgi:MFS family permease
MFGMTAACTFQFGLAYLIPALVRQGRSLEQAGLLAAAPTAGLLATLIVWGAAADRWGERVVLSTGLALSGAVLLTGALAGGTGTLGICFLLAGAAGASVHASSGRLIMGWFADRERGLAMGLRQTAQPLGVALAGLVLPVLAAARISRAVLFLAVFSLFAAVLVAVLVRDPQRAGAGAGTAGPVGSPYRTPVLWRIHAASALLIVPQFWPHPAGARDFCDFPVGHFSRCRITSRASRQRGRRCRTSASTVATNLLTVAVPGGPGSRSANRRCPPPTRESVRESMSASAAMRPRSRSSAR